MSSFNILKLDLPRQQAPVTDFYGQTDLQQNISLVGGDFAILQAAFRILDTPRGALFYAPNYGAGLFEILGDSPNLSVILTRCENAIVRTLDVVDEASLVILSDDRANKSMTLKLSIFINREELSAEFELYDNAN